MQRKSRRAFLRDLGVSAAVLPFVGGLPDLARAAAGDDAAPARKQRLVFMFSPNGTVPPAFWPDEMGENFALKPILAPLESFKNRTLLLKGISNRIRGDGDGHMRGMSCLLTAIELFPGNIQGGSDTPAGWASGISIDQEVKNFLQGSDATRTRFGSLEFGVNVPDRADPWTRWVYGGPNQPIAPISDPYQMFAKLYGRLEDQETLKSVLDDVAADLKTVRDAVSAEDRRILDEHLGYVREMERDLQAAAGQEAAQNVPTLEPGVRDDNDNMPKLSAMQADLMVSAFANDMARVANLQFTNSVGGARMTWLGVEEGHHALSHDPDLNEASQEKLIKINTWFCQQLADLARKLDETPEPGGDGTMLDHTTIIWTNELGKGNSHTLNDIPFVCVGNGLGFRMGRALNFDRVPHNRLHMAIAHAFGHRIDTFGKPEMCADGPLDLS